MTGQARSAETPPTERRRSRWRRLNLGVGLGIVLTVVVVALVSFVWTPFDPEHIDASKRLLGSVSRATYWGPTSSGGTCSAGSWWGPARHCLSGSSQSALQC